MHVLYRALERNLEDAFILVSLMCFLHAVVVLVCFRMNQILLQGMMIQLK